MGAVISAEVAEQRAQEMAALDPADRDVRIVFGILSGVVTDGRSRFKRRPVSISPLRFASAPWPTPPRCA